MTYDASQEYKNYLENRLSRLGIPYQILEKRLSLEQNLSMRIISDIAICIQNTDALAASVREHIMAGSEIGLDSGDSLGDDYNPEDVSYSNRANKLWDED